MGDLRSPDPAAHRIVLTRLFSAYISLRAAPAGALPSSLGQEFLKAIQAFKMDRFVSRQLPCLRDTNLFT